MRVESLLASSVSTELHRRNDYIDKLAAVPSEPPPFTLIPATPWQSPPRAHLMPRLRPPLDGTVRFLPPLAPPKEKDTRPVSLIEISTHPLDVPESGSNFAISLELKHALFTPAPPTDTLVDKLMDRIGNEVEQFATRRKEVVREAHKRRLEHFRGRVDKKTRAILRNRREAHVSRVKQLAIETATKDAVRCIIRAVLENGKDAAPPAEKR